MNKQGGIMNAELIKALKEDAEWAHANEWETPITLGDHLDAAADRLEAADKRIAELEQSKHELERLQAAIKVKGGDEYYPAEFAYLAVCKANEDKRLRIADLEEAQRWIPVGERLPTVSEYRNGDKFKSMDSNELIPFLVCCKDTEIPFRAFYDGKNWGDGWGKLDVTYWRLLPAPVKEMQNG